MLSTFPPVTWGRWHLDWGRCTHVMGIVNVTPDSFAGDGILSSVRGLPESSRSRYGLWLYEKSRVDGKPISLRDAAKQVGVTHVALMHYRNAKVRRTEKMVDVDKESVAARALEQAGAFVVEGAILIDVGGESTRPGFTALSLEEEVRRVIPVIQQLATHLPPEVIISIDTYKAEVARQALEAGAGLVNDIWGLQRDPEMAALVAESGVPVVLMANMRGSERHEIVSDVLRFLARSIDLALAAGVAWERIIVDPGIGFGTTAEENLTLLRRLGELRALGRPILLGTSRKKTIGLVLGDLPPKERVEGTAATVALGIAQGVDIVRVHDVHEIARVVKMSDAIVRNNFQRLATS